VPERAQVQALYDSTSIEVTGRFDPGLNLADHLDFRYLPGSLHDGYYDPEGLLSTLPAIATCLLGVFAGMALQRAGVEDRRKVRQLVIAGAVCLAVGWLWNLQFPVIKKIWTSSYVLVAGGWSFLLLALFYYVVDVRQWRRWCEPFVWIGMNPITLYLASSVLSFHGVANRLVGGSIKAWFDRHIVTGAGGILVTIVSLGFVFLLALPVSPPDIPESLTRITWSAEPSRVLELEQLRECPGFRVLALPGRDHPGSDEWV
jgi:predicted acyltransferase